MAELINYISNIKHNSITSKQVSVPVIGIDSAIISGAGKTPVI